MLLRSFEVHWACASLAAKLATRFDARCHPVDYLSTIHRPANQDPSQLSAKEIEILVELLGPHQR